MVLAYCFGNAQIDDMRLLILHYLLKAVYKAPIVSRSEQQSATPRATFAPNRPEVCPKKLARGVHA